MRLAEKLGQIATFHLNPLRLVTISSATTFFAHLLQRHRDSPTIEL
jgi:hypothetical protein